MAPRLGSYSQPQVNARRPPLVGKTDSATNRQFAPAPRKALSERKPSKANPRGPPIAPVIVVSENATSNPSTNPQSSTAIGKATSDDDLRPSNVARQASTSSHAPKPNGKIADRAISRDSCTVPTRAAPAVPNPPIPHHDSVPPNKADSLQLEPNESNVGQHKATIENADRGITALRGEEQWNENRASVASQASTGLPSKRHHKGYIGPWQLGKDLGSGATGRVRLARHRVTGHLVAMKIVTRRAAAAMQSQSLMDMGNEALTRGADQNEIPIGIEREVIMMRLLDHPSVIKLYDVWESRGEL